jgi:RimJ/RimL family protein N-acetyltransferase
MTWVPPSSDRIRLREYTIADEAELFEVFADPYARMFYPQMADRANVKAWIVWNLRNYDEFGFGLWLMELKAESRVIGDCGLTYQEVSGRPELEVGYHVVERARGRGYATEAARACLDFGFTHTSCETIFSIVKPLNVASCKVAARIHVARREFLNGDTAAVAFYTMRRDWEIRNGSIRCEPEPPQTSKKTRLEGVKEEMSR